MSPRFPIGVRHHVQGHATPPSSKAFSKLGQCTPLRGRPRSRSRRTGRPSPAPGAARGSRGPPRSPSSACARRTVSWGPDAGCRVRTSTNTSRSPFSAMTSTSPRLQRWFRATTCGYTLAAAHRPQRPPRARPGARHACRTRSAVPGGGGPAGRWITCVCVPIPLSIFRFSAPAWDLRDGRRRRRSRSEAACTRRPAGVRALRLALLERVSGYKRLPIVIDDALRVLEGPKRALTARCSKGIGTQTQVIHRLPDPPPPARADLVLQA